MPCVILISTSKHKLLNPKPADPEYVDINSYQSHIEVYI